MTIFKRIFLYLGIGFSILSAGSVSASTLAEAAKGLTERSYSKKVRAVEAIQSIDDPQVLPLLIALREGRLYTQKNGGTLVIAVDEDDQKKIANAVSGEPIGLVASSSLTKVRINNRVRGAARTAISSIELSANDRSARLQAVRNIIKSPDSGLTEVLSDALDDESDAKVRSHIEVALAIIQFNSDDSEIRTNAIKTLGASVEPRARALLESVLEKDDEGNYIESDAAIIALAEESLERVNSRTQFFKFIENLFFGLSLGSILLLAAIGMAITFGVMGVINMAHGEMIMIGAYTTFFVQQIFPNFIAGSVLIAIPLAFITAGAVGVLIERLVIRHLYGRPLETLLATFGVSLFLQQLARTYRSNNVPVEAPHWLSGSLQINGVLEFNYVHIYIILFSLIVLVVLALILKKTLLGLQMRAVTQNRAMANSMGIRSSRIDALTFGLGSGIAGMAGVALSQITNVGPNMGQDYIIDSFMVVVFGGVGNLLGTFFGAFSLGIVNKFLEPSVGPVIGKIMVLVFIILFIQWRPRGLFALKGRFVDD